MPVPLLSLVGVKPVDEHAEHAEHEWWGSQAVRGISIES